MIKAMRRRVLHRQLWQSQEFTDLFCFWARQKEISINTRVTQCFNFLPVHYLSNIHSGYIVAEIGHEEEYEREEEEKSEFHEDPLYVKGKDNPYFTSILFDEEFGTKGFAVSAPILDDNKLLGVIILKIGLDSLFEITLDRQGLGETGETFIINEDSFFVTPSRFLKGEEKGVSVQKVDTEHSRACFNESIIGHAKGYESIISFIDYRGEETFGTHREILDVGWCLLIKIDKSEALDTPLRNYIVCQIIVGLIVILVLTVFGFFTGRYFEKKRGKRKWNQINSLAENS